MRVVRRWVGGAYRACKHANVVFTLLLQRALEEVRGSGGYREGVG